VLAFSGSPTSGAAEEVPLWPKGVPGAPQLDPKAGPTLTVYLPSPDKATGAAVVICPGGGYGNLAMKHEGHDVARWLNSLGVAGLILKYRHAPAFRHPAPLQDAQRALRLVRARAKEWKLDPSRVGILGFSAGGHLASTAGTHFDRGKSDTEDPIDRESCRPDFLVLAYPVITLTGPYAHNGSRINLLGKDADPKLVESLCNEKQVTAETPPTFLVHTNEDKGVPPENSIQFYQACRQAKVHAELHIYEKGRHGLGLGSGDPAFSTWPDRCADWLRVRGIILAKKLRARKPRRAGSVSDGAVAHASGSYSNLSCPLTLNAPLPRTDGAASVRRYPPRPPHGRSASAGRDARPSVPPAIPRSLDAGPARPGR
jgi:acetyl esterase/lipase